jgi:hypothetical protein
MSEDEYGSAPSEDFIGSASSDMPHAVEEGASAVAGAFEIAAGALQSIFDPTGGTATMNEGTGRIAEAVEDADKAADDAKKAADEAWLAEKVAQHAREHAGDPKQTSMGPITKDEERRANEHTKEWEDIKRRLGEGPDVHLDPNVPKTPIPGGSPPPKIFVD